MVEEKRIFESQISSLFIANEYLKKCKSKGIDINVSPLCDLLTWADTLGYQKLLLLKNNKSLSINFLISLLEEFLSIGKNSEFKKFTSKIRSRKKINIVYSYCTKENFSKGGFFYDSYFNQSSFSEKNTYWFLISLDNYVPKKCNNVFIIYKKKGFFNFIYLIKFILKNLFKRNILHNCNNTTNVSQLYSQHFYETFNKFRFNLYLPYENRPYQNAIIETAKKISKKNKIFGYLHYFPQSFQLEMIYKSKYIDKLYVCSRIQKEVLSKYYHWPRNKINIIYSLKFLSLKKRKKCIFLPYDIDNKNFYLKNLRYFLKSAKASTGNIEISIHPLRKKDHRHLKFKEEIKEILKELKYQSFKNKNIYPIILGCPGGVMAECLQTVGRAYHISNNVFDFFSEKIWKNFKMDKVSDNIYKYTIIKKTNFVNINGKKNNFKKLLKLNKI